MGKKFKKFIATSIVVLAGTIFMSCGEKSFRVSFSLNGGTAIESQVIAENGLVVAPENPTKESAIFAGWFKDQACTIPWNFAEDKVTADTVIFAKWIEHSVVVLPETSLIDDGYVLSVVGENLAVPINGNFDLKLEINTEKFIADNFTLIRNGNQVETPSNYTEENGKRIYTYSFSEIAENQEFSVIGLVPKFYIATFETSENYIIEDVEGIRSGIIYGADYSFKINLKEGYTDSVMTMSVWNGQTRLYPNSAGVYTIENVTSNIAIDINNVYKNLYTISYPVSSMADPRFEASGLGTVFHGEELTFKVKQKVGYAKTPVENLIDIKVAGISVVAEHSYNLETREHTFTVPADKVRGNISIALNDKNWELDKYLISFAEDMVGYTLSTSLSPVAPGKYEVSYGEDFEFEVSLEDEYKYCQTFKVMVGDYDYTWQLNGENNKADKVAITNITNDFNIRLENLTKNSYNIEVPENAGYEIVLADGYSLPAKEGSEVKFDIRILEEAGFEQVVPDLGALTGTLVYYDNPLTSEDETSGITDLPSILIYKNGHYIIPSIDGNVRLEVSGIEKRKFTASVSNQEGFRIENMPSELVYGERYSFDVVVDDEYLDSLNNGEIKAKINGRSLTGSPNFEENKITYTINLNAAFLSNIGTSKVIPIEITGVAKNYYNVTFSLNSTSATFKDFETLGEGYTENSYTIKVKRGAEGKISSIAPSFENIIAPNHYFVNENETWLTEDIENINDLTGDTTFNVNIVPIKYYITFNLNGGENSSLNNSNDGNEVPKYIYTVESPINLADPTKEITEKSGNYYDFLGWFLEEDGELINIKDFTGYKDIEVSAHWGIKVGENETRKTLAEATAIANSKDKIIVLESGKLGNQVQVAQKDLEIVGENENVTLYVEDIASLNGGAAYGYSLISVSFSNAFKISNIKFELDESIDSEVFALKISQSSAEILDVETKNLALLKAELRDNNNVLVDGAKVADNKNMFAISSMSDGESDLVVKNSTFNTFKGILVEANENYNGFQTINIENNAFNKVEQIEENEEVSIDIKIVGIHDIVNIENAHKNSILGAELIVFENALADNLKKADLEELISKISVELDAESNFSPIKLYNIKEVIVGEDDGGEPILETRKTNEVLYNFKTSTYETSILFGYEGDIVNALKFSNVLNIDTNNIMNIYGSVEMPGSAEVWIKEGSTLLVSEGAEVVVNGILNTYGNVKAEGAVSLGVNGEIVNHSFVKLGLSYNAGNITPKLKMELGENNKAKILGGVVKASKTSLVYSYYKNTQNATFHFVAFQVYVGIEKAGQTLNDIVIENVNGLLYSTGTNTSANLTDTVNDYGYIDVVLDANVVGGVAKLSSAKVWAGGKTYEIEMQLAPYAPEVLADESYAMGYVYGAYPADSGKVEAYIFNALQTITENTDASVVSTKDNFSKLIASGSVAKVKEKSNVDNVAPTSSSDHFITFRQYVGIEHAGEYVAETYQINGVQSSEVLNIHVLGQNQNNKNRVDNEGYLHYIFDANVTYLNLYGVWFNEKVNVETIQVFFTLGEETFEIRVDVKDMLVYNRTSNMDIMLGNTSNIGIENSLNILTYADEKYSISGRVYKVGETEEIKNNETFYNANYTSSGYFVSYRIFNLDSENQIKPLIGKNVTFSVLGYEGKTWCGGKVLANGYVEFITELLVTDGIVQNGELTLTYQIEGEAEKTYVIELKDLVIVEDKASKELAIIVEDFKVGETGTGVNFTNFNITPVDEGSYKVTSDFFTKVAENSNAYNNPYALENSTGYFVAFKAFAGVRMWGDEIDVTLKYNKEASEVKSETRKLKVDGNGYIGIFVDTMVEGTTLGFDTLIVSLKNADNETISYLLDFSEVTVAVYETE